MSTASPGDVTRLLLRWNEGSDEARAKLIARVYRELRQLAGRSMRSERGDHTLQPTALVHEAYQRLIDQHTVRWQNRAHFFAVAATLMRRILVDHARKRAALRRGAGAEPLALLDPGAAQPGPDLDLLAVDDALTQLAAFDPGQARVVELRFFGGLTEIETAEVVGQSRATVQRDWALARAWLRRRLSQGG